jgi:hypothetical protein
LPFISFPYNKPLESAGLWFKETIIEEKPGLLKMHRVHAGYRLLDSFSHNATNFL